MPGRSTDAYLFIDGEYLRLIYISAMQKVYQADGEIDFQRIKNEARAKRAFLYDCIDDDKRAGEVEADYLKRVETQESYFRTIGDLNGFHIRQGSLRGNPKKRRRQKEVDVLLAVDMLTHGYDGNMEKAILLAGDLDFRPVVEAIVRRGVFVEIWYEPKSAAAELPGAADYGRKLDFNAIYEWSSEQFKSIYQLPRWNHQSNPEIGGTATLKVGQHQGQSVSLMKQQTSFTFLLRVEWKHGLVWYSHADKDVLERYFTTVFGPINWSPKVFADA